MPKDVVLPVAVAAVLSACASSPSRPAASAATATPDPAATPSAAPEESSASAASAPAPATAAAPPARGDPAIPAACAPGSDAGVCTPDPAFVKRLCNAWYPDVALVLMGKDTPFTRMYLRGDVDGWNADGGMSARARLLFDEEVLVLKRRVPQAGGIVVGNGGAQMLVLRWDGNCYTLEEGELSAKKPPSVKTGPIPWRRYLDPTRDALLARPRVLAAFQKRGKECKGAISGEVSRACEQADDALSAAVVAEIRAGTTIPTPTRLP